MAYTSYSAFPIEKHTAERLFLHPKPIKWWHDFLFEPNWGQRWTENECVELTYAGWSYDEFERNSEKPMNRICHLKHFCIAQIII